MTVYIILLQKSLLTVTIEDPRAKHAIEHPSALFSLWIVLSFGRKNGLWYPYVKSRSNSKWLKHTLR